MIRKYRVICLLLSLTICLILMSSIVSCGDDKGLLEDATDQVKLKSSTGPDYYTYVGQTEYLYVSTDDARSKLPANAVYVWTVTHDGNIIKEIIHDEYVNVRSYEVTDAAEDWPTFDEIKHKFQQAGTYKFRVDLYDDDEYRTLKNMAPRRGTYTFTVY